MCWALERALSHEGYQVVTATRGLEGIDRAKESEPSLVILDLKMPDIDGIGVLKEIKNINSSIPVIMITAHGTIDTAIEAMKIGATDYITKPFKLEEIKIKVKQALHLSNLDSQVDFLRQELGKEIREDCRPKRRYKRGYPLNSTSCKNRYNCSDNR